MINVWILMAKQSKPSENSVKNLSDKNMAVSQGGTYWLKTIFCAKNFCSTESCPVAVQHRNGGGGGGNKDIFPRKCEGSGQIMSSMQGTGSTLGARKLLHF